MRTPTVDRDLRPGRVIDPSLAERLSEHLRRVGVEVETEAFGKILISERIHTKWKAVGEAVLGDPIQDYFSLPGSGSAAYFEHGMIVDRGGNRIYVLHGYIYAQYRNLRDINGFLGLPTSDQAPAAAGGQACTFDNGHIYWHASFGAFEVHGAILTRYLALGGPGSFVGYPTSNELPVLKNKTEVGRLSRFAGAVIYWSAGTGAWEVHGDIRAKYENELNGPIGVLGFPKSNETRSPKGTCQYNDFANGILMWMGSYTNMRLIQNLELYIDRINSKGDDGFLGGGQDVYFIMDIKTNKGYNIRERLPRDGDYGADQALNRTLPRFGVPTGDLTISVDFEGWDSDGGFIRGWFGDNDDRLGRVRKTYTIDDLWGINEDATHWQKDFMIAYKIREIVQYDASKFRQNLFWNYENFSTAKLTKSQFAQTFTDVDEDESVIWHPFNALYYELVYKSMADGGNCYGMSLESVYAQVGRSIYNEPIGRFAPTDGTEPKPGTHNEMINEINIKHGYQCGAQYIDWFVLHFLSGATHNPVQCFEESRQQFARGDYPVVSLTSDYWGAGAHTVRPYKWDKSSKPWKMYIADPNTPYPKEKDDNKSFNIIYVDPDANTFTFTTKSGTKYHGGTWTGGRMFSTPFCVHNMQPRTPFWEVMALLFGGGLFFLGGDGTTKQITDSQGRTFFEPNLRGNPAKWSDIVRDEGKRIPGMALLPAMNELSGAFVSRFGSFRTEAELIRRILSKDGAPQVFAMRTPPRRKVRPIGGVLAGEILDHAVLASDAIPGVETLTRRLVEERGLKYEIQGQGGGEYQWGMRTGYGSITVEGNLASGSVDQIGIQPQLATPLVEIVPSGEKMMKVCATRWSPHAQRIKGYEVSELISKNTAPIRVKFEDEDESLSVVNEGGDSSFAIKAQVGLGRQANIERRNIQLKAGETAKIRPADWSPTAIAGAPMKMRVFDKGGSFLREQDL